MRWLVIIMLVLGTFVTAQAKVITTRLSDMPKVAFTTERGTFQMTLRRDKAPYHTKRILTLVDSGFYDGIFFHRVVPDFVAQAGDARLSGRQNPARRLNLEISNLSHKRGAVGMARIPSSRNSATTQFYVVLRDAPHLDGDYTVFGEVTRGMHVVDKITKGDMITSAEVLQY